MSKQYGITYANNKAFRTWKARNIKGYFYNIPLYTGKNEKYYPLKGKRYKIRKTDKINLHRADCSLGAHENTTKYGKATFSTFKLTIKWPKRHDFNKILICSKCHGKTTKRITDEMIEELFDFGYEVYKKNRNPIKKRNVKWRINR